jgi:hypothetical protein
LAGSSLALFLVGTSACSATRARTARARASTRRWSRCRAQEPWTSACLRSGSRSRGQPRSCARNAGGIDVSADRRHVGCESSGSTHTVSVYTRDQGSYQLGEFQSPVFSPPGDRLALSGSDALFVAAADGSQLSALPGDAEFGSVLGAALWSSSGRYVAVLAQHGALIATPRARR